MFDFVVAVNKHPDNLFNEDQWQYGPGKIIEHLDVVLTVQLGKYPVGYEFPWAVYDPDTGFLDFWKDGVLCLRVQCIKDALEP